MFGIPRVLRETSVERPRTRRACKTDVGSRPETALEIGFGHNSDGRVSQRCREVATPDDRRPTATSEIVAPPCTVIRTASACGAASVLRLDRQHAPDHGIAISPILRSTESGSDKPAIPTVVKFVTRTPPSPSRRKCEPRCLRSRNENRSAPLEDPQFVVRRPRYGHPDQKALSDLRRRGPLRLRGLCGSRSRWRRRLVLRRQSDRTRSRSDRRPRFPL